jgi:AcrR family transcriptional regulator
MLDEQGLDGLTLRAIARRAGVSHGAPLRHFPSLASLLAAVAAEGFEELIAAVDRETGALAEDAPALTRLAAAGRSRSRTRVSSP